MAGSLKSNISEKDKKSDKKFNAKYSSSGKNTSVKSDVQEEPLSPTKETINMFEELAGTYLTPTKTHGEASDLKKSQKDDAIVKKDNDDVIIKKDNDDYLIKNSNGDLERILNDQPDLTTSEVSIEELKEKMKTILSIPLPDDSNDIELKEDEINRIHEENMKKLKEKLRLNTDEMSEASILLKNNNISSNTKTVEIANNITATITETKAKPIPRSKASSSVLPKCNVEEAKKIYTKKRPDSKGRQKSIIQYTVFDLTSETVQISNTSGSKTPKFTAEEKVPIIVNNELYNEYHKERELIEMAKKEKIETGNPEINIEYIENTVKKSGENIIMRMMRILTCGII